MSIGTNLGVFLTNYNNALGNENYKNIKNIENTNLFSIFLSKDTFKQ